MTNKSTSSIKQRRKTIEKVTLLDCHYLKKPSVIFLILIACCDDASDCGTLCIPVAASLAGGVLPILLCLFGNDCYRLLYPEWQYASVDVVINLFPRGIAFALVSFPKFWQRCSVSLC